jgi:hypothetical protein
VADLIRKSEVAERRRLLLGADVPHELGRSPGGLVVGGVPPTARVAASASAARSLVTKSGHSARACPVKVLLTIRCFGASTPVTIVAHDGPETVMAASFTRSLLRKPALATRSTAAVSTLNRVS